MVLSTFGSPWVDVNTNYGGDRAWRQTPYVRQFLDPQIPEGVYNSFLTERGFGGQDAASKYWQGNYGQLLTGYKSAMRANPALSFRDFLGKQLNTQGLMTGYLGQTPRTRGEYQANFTGPTRLIDFMG